MESNKFHPEFLAETRLGMYYVSPIISLKVDNDLRTIWLNLETNKSTFGEKPLGALNFSVIRRSLGKKSDFVLNLNRKYLVYFDLFKESKLSIPQMIHYILNPRDMGEEKNLSLIEYIESLNQNLNVEERKELYKFGRLVESLPRESMPKLLGESKFTLLFGNLLLEEEYKNNVLTLKNPELKKHNISSKTLEKYFGGIVLSEKTFMDVFSALSIGKIISDPPELPKTGGAIFIDMGGTGKSMMKSALKNFWEKELGGECIEKDGIAEFTGDVNYATLIRSWYFGSNNDNSSYDKNGLFNTALKKKVPSLLIVDEANRFVRTSTDEYHDAGAEMIINEFKKYLTGRDKGGVQGYVLTLFIANVDREHLNPQLSQGGERLTTVYFGPPTLKEDWLELIEIYFKANNLNFTNRTKEKDLLLANLILKHNSSMPKEEFMIPPRKFGSHFCESYIEKYFKEDDDLNSIDSSGGRFDRILKSFSFGKKKSIKLDYIDFLKNIIDDLLLIEVKNARMDVSSKKIDYYSFVGIREDFAGNNFSSEEIFELKLILSENITQRIMSGNYIFEVLGIDSNFSDQVALKKIIQRLKNKYSPQRNMFIDNDGEKYILKTKIGIDLLNELFKKIPDTNLGISNIQKSSLKIDFSRFFS